MISSLLLFDNFNLELIENKFNLFQLKFKVLKLYVLFDKKSEFLKFLFFCFKNKFKLISCFWLLII